MSGLKASVMGTKGPARSLALSSGRLIEAVYNPVRGSTPLLRKLIKLKALECSEVVVDMGMPQISDQVKVFLPGAAVEHPLGSARTTCVFSWTPPAFDSDPLT
ncbi:hypothetical protein ALP93_200110 [Pseudomonas syringae pv. helianthi]|nr:hypothetical protein ALP93_200110 [Pseudomonas syringae pv. helianthi]